MEWGINIWQYWVILESNLVILQLFVGYKAKNCQIDSLIEINVLFCHSITFCSHLCVFDEFDICFQYLYNLDPNSAFYDPKTRSMRENPYKNTGNIEME